MIGKNVIELNASEFVKGMSSSDHIANGGFSPAGNHINPIITPGAIYSPASLVDSDTDTRLTGNIIATSSDDDVYLGYERKMVTSDGKYYRYNGTKIPEAALRTDSVNTYASGFTDMISFAGETYVTTKEGIIRWDEGAAIFNTVFTVTIASPAVFSATAHGLAVGSMVRFLTTGALPTGLSVGTTYFIISAGFTANAFQVSTVLGGSAVNTSGSQSGTHTFFIAFTNAPSVSYPHPAIVFENNAFYGDGNLLLKQTSAGGAPVVVLTLSADQIIIALGIDPGTGYLLISTTTLLNVSNTLRGICRLLWYDGFSLKPVKSAIVDDMILAFYSVGATMFIGYGQNLGFLNGSGITFLRKLANVTLDNTQLPYKQHFSNIGKTLYVADGRQVLAFGEIQRGSKVFYYAIQNKENTNKLQAIFDVGGGKLGMSFATNKFFTFDTTSVATTYGADFYSNRFNFPRPVYLRNVWVEYAGSVANGANPISMYIYDEKQNTAQVSSFANTTGAAEYFRESLSLDFKVRTMQIYFVLQNVNPGVRRIVINYDVAE